MCGGAGCSWCLEPEDLESPSIEPAPVKAPEPVRRPVQQPTHGRLTSALAYEAVMEDGTVNRSCQRIYAKLYDKGPMTGTECFISIDEDLKSEGKQGINWNTRTRLSELRARGLIYETGTRSCKITGRMVIEWDVTDRLPGPPPKKIPRPKPDVLAEAASQLRLVYRSWLDEGGQTLDELDQVSEWLDFITGP